MLYHVPKEAFFQHGTMIRLSNGASLSSQAVNPNAISYEPKRNSRKVKGKRNGDRARAATGSSGGQENKIRESVMVQAIFPNKSWADVSIYGFWKWGTSTLFDMRIVNLDAVYYLC